MTIALKSVDIENNMATYLHRDSGGPCPLLYINTGTKAKYLP